MELMETFGKCVRSVAGGALPDRAQMRILEKIVMRYPWFTTARLLYSAGSRAGDPALKLHMLAYPLPDFMLVDISPEELGMKNWQPAVSPEPARESVKVSAPEFKSEPESRQEREQEDPIDKFLSRGGEHRIVPDEHATDEDAAAESARFDLTDDILSEELADIYAAQGLNRQAKEIYQRLCLLNPEKSVYFASIIDKITLDNN